MTNEIINKKSENLKFSVEKLTVLANEKKSKVFNNLVRHKVSNI